MSRKVHIGMLTIVVVVCMAGSVFGERMTPLAVPNGPDYYRFTNAPGGYATPDVIKGIYRELRYYRNNGGSDRSLANNGSVTRVKFSCKELSPNSASIDPVGTAWSANLKLTSIFRLRGTSTTYLPPGGSNTVTADGTLLSIEQDAYMDWVPREGALKVTVMPVARADSPEQINFKYNLKATTATSWTESSSSSFSFSSADGFKAELGKVTGTSKMRLIIDGNPGWLQLGGMWAHFINDTRVELGFGASFVTDAQYDVTRSVVQGTAVCTYTYKAWNNLQSEVVTIGNSESTQCAMTTANFLANVHWRASAGTVSEWNASPYETEEPKLETPQPVGQSYKHFFHIDPAMRKVRMIDRFASFHSWAVSVTSAAGHPTFPSFDLGSMRSGADTQEYRVNDY